MSRSRDRAAVFLEHLRPFRGVLEGYCRRMLRDRSQVDDVLQTAVAQAFARFGDFAPGTNFKAWVFRFVTLEIFNQNRRQGLIRFTDCPEEVDPAAGPQAAPRDDALDALLREPEVIYDLLEDEVADALQRLTVPERSAFLLRALGEFSYQEIHEQMAIPLGSVIGYLSRARGKLRESLLGYAARRGLSRRNSTSGESPP